MRLSKLGRHNEPVPKNVASPVVYMYWLFLVLKWVQCSHTFLQALPSSQAYIIIEMCFEMNASPHWVLQSE